MIDTVGQDKIDAHVSPIQTRHKEISFGDTGAITHDATLAAHLEDRYIPSNEQDAFIGIYTRESLLETAEKSMRTVLGLDEGGIDSHISEPVTAEEKTGKAPNDLDEGDKDLVRRLQARDQEVRKHEQAHAAAAGEYVMGAPVYHYQQGPDGKMYAIGGSLAVDVGKEATAGENRRKAMILRAAAFGVEDPSAADSMVAAQANDLARHAVQIQA